MILKLLSVGFKSESSTLVLLPPPYPSPMRLLPRHPHVPYLHRLNQHPSSRLHYTASLHRPSTLPRLPCRRQSLHCPIRISASVNASATDMLPLLLRAISPIMIAATSAFAALCKFPFIFPIVASRRRSRTTSAPWPAPIAVATTALLPRSTYVCLSPSLPVPCYHSRAQSLCHHSTVNEFNISYSLITVTRTLVQS